MKRYLYIILFFVFFCSCEEEDSRDFPAVTTSFNLMVTDEGVSVEAVISNANLFEIIDHGFVYGDAGNDDETLYSIISLGTFSGGGMFNAVIDRNLVKDKAYVAKAYVRIKNRLIYGNAVKFVSKGAKAPIIERFFPETAYVGDTIQIKGRYFGDKNVDNLISWGSDNAKTIFSSDSLLKCIVPTPKQSVSNLLSVSVAGKNSISSKKFELKAPVVYGIYPTKELPQENVKIRGKGFSQIKMVDVGGITHPEYDLVVTDSTITFRLSDSLSPGKKNIQFSQLDRTILIAKQLEIVYPEIKKISPLVVWLDSIITIRGIRLDKLSRFTTGYQDQESIFSSDSLVKVRITHVFNTGAVRAGFLHSEVVSTQILSLNPPVITSITPSIAHCGETLHIKGDRFFKNLYSSSGELTYQNKNEATFVVPWTLPAGNFPIDLMFYEKYPTSPVKYTIPEVKITKVSPREIKRGSTIDIEVENLPANTFSPYFSCSSDGKYLETIEVLNGSIKAKFADYVEYSEYPSISVVVGGQTKTISGELHCTEKWERVKSSIGLKEPSLFTFCDGDSYAFCLGETNSTIKKFDQASGQWLLFDYVPNPAFNVQLNCFSLGRNMFFIGYDLITQQGSIYKYGLDGKTWTRIKDLPSVISGLFRPYSFVIGGNAFVGTQQGFYKYDLINNEWVEKKRLPTSIFEIRSPISFSVGTKGYVAFFTGSIDKKEYNEFWKYDSVTDSWVDMGEMPVSVYQGGSATVYNGKVYIAGKSYRVGDKFVEYDVVTDQFKELLPPPAPRSDNIFTFMYGDTFYFTALLGSPSDNWMYKIPVSEFKNIYR